MYVHMCTKDLEYVFSVVVACTGIGRKNNLRTYVAMKEAVCSMYIRTYLCT